MEVASLATSELRVWLQGGSCEGSIDSHTEQVDEVSKMLAARLSAGVRRCGNLTDSDLDSLRMALVAPASASSPATNGGALNNSVCKTCKAGEQIHAVIFAAATAVVRSHYANLSSNTDDESIATTSEPEIDVIGLIGRFRDATMRASPTDLTKQHVGSGSTASEPCGTPTEPSADPTNTDEDVEGGHSMCGSSRVYASAEFEEAASDMFDMMHELSVALLHVLATGLGLKASAASELCDTATPGPTEFSSSVLRLYRYFGGSRPEAACGVHADIGLLTLSPRADIPGLTVLDGTEHAWKLLH